MLSKELGDRALFVTTMSQKTAREWLAVSLIQLFNLYNGPINLSRDDLANFVGTATENLIRLLKDLKTKEVIDHIQMKNESKRAGLAYKPSGAGGGDFGISFGDDAQRIKKFSEHLSAKNIFNFILSLRKGCHLSGLMIYILELGFAHILLLESIILLILISLALNTIVDLSKLNVFFIM